MCWKHVSFFVVCVCVFIAVGVSSKPHYLSPPYLTASALNDNTIDIRVSVTINTVNPGGVCRPAMLPTPSPSLPTSPPSLILRTSSPACHQPPYAPSMLPNILQSVHSLSGGSCTLSDLKKQRSQYRVVGLVGSANSTEYPAPNSFVFPPAESPGSGDVKGQVEPASSWTTSPDQNKTSGQYPSSGIHLGRRIFLLIKNVILFSIYVKMEPKRSLPVRPSWSEEVKPAIHPVATCLESSSSGFIGQDQFGTLTESLRLVQVLNYHHY